MTQKILFFSQVCLKLSTVLAMKLSHTKPGISNHQLKRHFVSRNSKTLLFSSIDDNIVCFQLADLVIASKTQVVIAQQTTDILLTHCENEARQSISWWDQKACLSCVLWNWKKHQQWKSCFGIRRDANDIGPAVGTPATSQPRHMLWWLCNCKHCPMKQLLDKAIQVSAPTSQKFMKPIKEAILIVRRQVSSVSWHLQTFCHHQLTTSFGCNLKTASDWTREGPARSIMIV